MQFLNDLSPIKFACKWGLKSCDINRVKIVITLYDAWILLYKSYENRSQIVFKSLINMQKNLNKSC